MVSGAISSCSTKILKRLLPATATKNLEIVATNLKKEKGTKSELMETEKALGNIWRLYTIATENKSNRNKPENAT